MKIKLTLFLLSVLASQVSWAQFQTNNDAISLGGDIYRLTEAVTNQAGSIWYKLEHDVRKPITVAGQFYFGTDPIGADGLVFVMQNNCLNAGTAGGGIGYDAMPGQSIGVEFDTYENSSTSGGAFDNSDPTFDHIAVEKQGNVNHANVANTLVAPVQMDAVKTNVKDGVWYDFQISYDPTTTNLQVFFNGSLRVNTTVDLLNTIFLGDPYVYWGFTSSTGGFWNEHRVFIDKDLTTLTLPDFTICPPATVSSIEMPSLTKFNAKNLALGKPATASSTESGNPLNAGDAFDNQFTFTRWASQWNSDPEWIYVDLGASIDLDSVNFYWETAHAATFDLQVSTDAISWTTIYAETNPARFGAGPLEDHIKPVASPSLLNIRYVRMLGNTRAVGSPYGYSIYEFQVFGKPKYVWSPNDGSIDDINSPTPVFSPTSTTTYTVNAPNDCSGSVISTMTITVDCAAPVELIAFDAQKVGNKGHLTWTTAMELNVNYFNVMKSYDGITFFSIGKVKSLGNSNTTRSYAFDDINLPAHGTVYYQLMTVDFDATSSKSEIKQLSSETNGDIFISSPVFDLETALVVPLNTKWVKLTVVDVLGRVLFEERYTDTSSPIVFGQSLPPTSGFYVAIVQTDSIYKTIKIVKRK